MDAFKKLIRFHVGTSGWSYKHWSGVFYPEDISSDQYLEYYTTKFDCVEINSSFYHLPKGTTVAGWVRRTPHSFMFCPKISRYITHSLKFENIEDPLKRFLNVFQELKKQMGPVLIQLPPGLTFNKSKVKTALGVLGEQCADCRFAIEVRHPSWITGVFFDLLSQYSMAYVIADSGNRYPDHEAVTADFVYLRFHGHEQLYASDYCESDLHAYAEKITEWLEDHKEVWVFFNNDFYGYAVKNAEMLSTILESYQK